MATFSTVSILVTDNKPIRIKPPLDPINTTFVNDGTFKAPSFVSATIKYDVSTNKFVFGSIVYEKLNESSIQTNVNANTNNKLLSDVFLTGECTVYVSDGIGYYKSSTRDQLVISAMVHSGVRTPEYALPDQSKPPQLNDNNGSSQQPSKNVNNDVIIAKEVIYKNYYDPLVTLDFVDAHVSVVAIYNLPIDLKSAGNTITGKVEFVGYQEVMIELSNNQKVYIQLTSKYYQTIDKF